MGSAPILRDDIYLQSLTRRVSIFQSIQTQQQNLKLSQSPTTIRITLADGSIKEGHKWRICPFDLTSDEISKNAFVAKVDGVLWDMNRPLESDCNLTFCICNTDEEARRTFWHSCIHILALSLEQTYGCRLCTGPCTSSWEEGIYYDAFYGVSSLNEEHFIHVEAAAKKAAKEKHVFERLVVTRDQALDIFSDNPFKVAIIRDLPEDETVTIYRCGPLVDMCSGPLIPNTSFVEAFQCLRVSSVYSRGNKDREILQRVHAACYPYYKFIKQEPSATMLERAEKSALRKLAQKQFSWLMKIRYDQWVLVPQSGQRPTARYKHGAAVVDGKLYIAGGSCNRYLSDLQVFDLKSLTWSSMKLSAEATDTNASGTTLAVVPAISGHSMIKWGRRLLLIAGLSKHINDMVTVRFVDLDSYNFGVVETLGNVPVARSGQSVTLFGSKLIMFGGEDRNRRPLNDVHVLDLETMTWSAVETTQTPPSPRSDHTAVLHAERYLFIFGGCSHSIFFNDLHMLDLETMEWSQPQMQGDVVTAMAGHAGVEVYGHWFIVGGGDNKRGCLDTIVINMSNLVSSLLLSAKGKDPLASEGISVSLASIGGEYFLVTFGGYNGNYSNEVFVMRIKPRTYLRPKILKSPAAAASVTATFAFLESLPDIIDRVESSLMVIPVDTCQRDLSAEINSVRESKKTLELSLKEISSENSAMKTKIGEAKSNYSELSKELHFVQGQLVAERSRYANLEAQKGELQKKLESLPLLEQQVQSLRAEISAFEPEVELAGTEERQRSGGLWKWVAG